MLPAELIPSTFLALAVAHFVALLSPGPDFFLITGHAVRNQFSGSVFICIGVAIGHAIYITMAIFGWSTIRDNALLFLIIELLGACYLLWVGFMLIKSKPQSNNSGKIKGLPLSPFYQFMVGNASALLNPKNMLFYMSLMTVILGKEVTLNQQIVCGIWMTLVVLIWDLGVASAIGHKKVNRFLTRKVYLIERGAGAVLLSFGLSLLFGHAARNG